MKNTDTRLVRAHIPINLIVIVFGDLKLHSPNDLLWLGKPHSYQVFNSTSSIGSKGKRLQVAEVSKLWRNGSIKRVIRKLKELIDFGMVPLRLLYPRLRYVNRVKEPMIVGMAP
ncbi:hypothetical protein LXL04_004338 [Taraxacum kok-saghyz]